MSIVGILGLVFVACCLIWFGAVILQVALTLIVFLFGILSAIIGPLFGLVCFICWFPFQPRRALAAFRGGQMPRPGLKAPTYVQETTDLGERPFHRKP